MHITLHLTTACNLNCNYCYAPPVKGADMTQEIAIKAIELASKISPNNTGIIFFGGEPLLKKDLIKSSIEHCLLNQKTKNYNYHFKVTTNGLLLDEDFLKYCDEVNLSVALSIDGIEQAHNYHRKSFSGINSFEIVEPKMELLLKYQPYASFLMVVSPETVKYYSKSVEFLFQKGVKYIVASLNYAGNWTDADIKELKKQYKLLSKIYEEKTIRQEKFYFSPFEIKFTSHINSDYSLCEQCHLGSRQLSVSVMGDIFPCVQFVKDSKFKIGDVENGIDDDRRKKLQYLYSPNEECKDCAISNRCNNGCSCLNWQTTGSLNTISPVLCETEKIITPIVDKLGEKLFTRKAPLFMQKHYNSAYPVLSLIDDIK